MLSYTRKWQSECVMTLHSRVLNAVDGMPPGASGHNIMIENIGSLSEDGSLEPLPAALLNC